MNITYIVDRKYCGISFFGKTVVESDMVPWNDTDAVIVSVYKGGDEIKDELKKILL